MLGYGAPREHLFSMFHVIQHMKYYTRTAFGDSVSTIGGKEGFIALLQGIRQGNGQAPPTWSGVSSRMFEVCHSFGHATKFKAPITNKVLEIFGVAYVDDADLLAASDGRNDPVHTLATMRDTINCWEGVANTTGGVIKAEKSWWYLIHYEWDNQGNWSCGDREGLVCKELTAKTSQGRDKVLKYLKPDEGIKMLGVYLTPTGSNKLQLEKLKEKATTIAEHARAGHLQRHEAWIALTTMVMKSLEYPLPTLTLAESECTKIMWIV